jgi:SAM-dependent methyltransferase
MKPISVNGVDNRKLYNEKWSMLVDMHLWGPHQRYRQALTSDILATISSLKSPSTVLEVGCGIGIISQLIAQRFPTASVRGIDFSEEGINIAKAMWDFQNLEFTHELDSVSLNQKWDMVCAFEVLEHVEDWQTLLMRMVNVAEKYICLSFPTGRMRPHEVSLGHVRNFKKGEVENFLEQHGFVATQLYYAGFPFLNPLYRNLQQLLLGKESSSNSYITGKYGLSQKVISHILYFVFRFVTTKYKYGDQFVGLFERQI